MENMVFRRGLLALLCLIGISFCAELRIIPEKGALNPRVPIIKPDDSGARGKAVNFEKAFFTYNLQPHLLFEGAATVRFFVRDDKRQEEKDLLTLTGNDGGTLSFNVSSAATGRVPFLEFKDAKGRTVKTRLSEKITDKWQEVILSWQGQDATLKLGGKKYTLKISAGFDPASFTCQSWHIDELLITASNGTAEIDWENDYSAKLTVNSRGGIGVQVTGFDTYVISDDKSKRDYPVVMITNSSEKAGSVKLDFKVSSEINGFDKSWSDTVNIAAKTAENYYIKFPFELKNDIYHLNLSISYGKVNIAGKKNFVFVERLAEKAGAGKFGLHNYHAKDFGYWPDALPVDIAHRYLRWGYVEGPAWVRDYNGDYGIDPELSSENWHWNHVLDWMVLSGKRPLISMQSYPLLERHRDYPYKVKMRKRPWGVTGGFPKLDKFARFMDEAAKRYKGKAFMWEVENEPNSAYMPENPEDYWKICKVVYDKVKKYTPTARVFVISGTSNFPAWMGKALAAGKGQKFYDGISWHTYSREAPDKSGLQELILDAKKLVKPETPLINSETGMVTAKREVVDKPLSQQYVDQMINDAHPAFVSSGAWPGKIMSEFQTSRGIVKNVVLNFIEGVEAYVFFGWSPSRPVINGDWFKTDKTPAFQILTATRKGEITPNLYTLAIAVCTAQFEPVNLKAAKKEIKSYGVRGGIFSKQAGGELAVLWSPTGSSSALIRSSQGQIDLYSVWGRHSVLKPTGKAAGNENIFRIELDENPVYLHTKNTGMSFIPSPVESVLSTATGVNSGNISINFNNYSDKEIRLTVKAPGSGDISFSPDNNVLTIAPKQYATFTTAYVLNNSKSKLKELNLPFKIAQDNAGDFDCMVNMERKKVITLPRISEDAGLANLKDYTKNMLKHNLDSVDRVTIGRPPKFASIQEDYFWGGKDELSAEVFTGYNNKGLYLYLRVNDQHGIVPANWPGIDGSSIELFFDLRSAKKGFGESFYGRGVYQILALPNIKETGSIKTWSPQSTDINQQGLKALGGPEGKNRYWLAVFMPWSMAGNNGNPPAKISFDVGVNGPFAGKAKRKTQMLLFGTVSNFKNTSGFALSMLEK